MIQASHALGTNSQFINFDTLEVPMHEGLLEPVQALKQSAREAGFELGICSAYRPFSQQLRIWNEKASGERPLLNACGERLNVDLLDPAEIVEQILLWSALPGTSRHHWGTDFDVVDAEVVAKGYRPVLSEAECLPGGAFFAFHCWLDTYLATTSDTFYRPYTEHFDFGVSPEPWHLSYRPLAQSFSKAVTLGALQELLEGSDIAFRGVVLDRLEHIYRHYVARYF